jgi:hypothetical protein
MTEETITKKQASIDFIIELKKKQSVIGISILFLFLSIINAYFAELSIISIIGIIIMIKFLTDTKKKTNELQKKYGV